MGFALLNIGTSALTANNNLLKTVGQNISNVNTPGYSRQSTVLSSVPGTFSGAGFFGRGVTTDTVTRAYNGFLTQEAATTASLSSADQTRLDQLNQLQQLFPTDNSNVGALAQQMLNAFTDVANAPQDLSARQTVLSDAQQFATTMNAAGDQINTLQSGVTSSLQSQVDAVNKLAQQVASLNQQIANAQGTGQQPNDLLDQRDQLVKQIGQYVQVTTIAAPDGTLGVFIGGAQQLVLGNQATALSVTTDTFDPTKSRVSVSDAVGTRQLDMNSIAGGSIPALIQFQDNDLTHARDLLGQLATAFASSVNQQQALGLTLGTPPSAGPPIFSMASPVALPAQTNARDASGNFVSSVSLSISNASLLQASEYTLQADPSTPGNYLVTRLSDGQQTSVADGGTVDGFTINVGTPAPAASDRFLLQPVSYAPQSISLALTDPKGIAAASPVVATMGSANTGTAAVDSLSVVSSSIDPTLTANISFTSSTGDYNWSLVDSSGTVTSSGTGTWTAGQPISLNGFNLQLSGVPANGDTVQVAPTTFTAMNNGNALALAALQNSPLVGQQLDGSGTATGGSTVTDAYNLAMTDIGVRTQSAQAASTMSQNLAQAAATNLSNQTGVNLDEEAAHLIQYQQSYQAAAKVIQVAQAIFDSLLNATGQ